jgi:hypothetical protein
MQYTPFASLIKRLKIQINFQECEREVRVFSKGWKACPEERSDIGIPYTQE